MPDSLLRDLQVNDTEGTRWAVVQRWLAQIATADAGDVNSILGTVGEIAVSNPTGNVTISLANPTILPGNTTVTGGLLGFGAGAMPAAGQARFTGYHASGIAALTTAAESWIGPSSAMAVHFKAGKIGFGSPNPLNAFVFNDNPLVRGIEMIPSIGQVFCYDRVAGDYAALNIAGSTVTLSSGVSARVVAAAASVSILATLITVASAAGSAGLRLLTGVAPTAPVDGDMWQDGTNFRIRIGGVTKTVTVT